MPKWQSTHFDNTVLKVHRTGLEKVNLGSNYKEIIDETRHDKFVKRMNISGGQSMNNRAGRNNHKME